MNNMRNKVIRLVVILLTLGVFSLQSVASTTPREVKRLRAKRELQGGKLRLDFKKPRRQRYSQSKRRDLLVAGSLKHNIERLAKLHGWRTVVWNVNSDYQWYGNTRVAARGVVDLFSKVLHDYPLQAVFYKGNHILVINPRTLQ